MTKRKLSVFFCFVLVLATPISKAGEINQNPENISKPSLIGLYSKETADVEQKKDAAGLYGKKNYLRAVGGGGGGFVDPGGNENEGGYNDPPKVPLKSFPGVLLLCLAIGYGIYKKKTLSLKTHEDQNQTVEH